MNVEASIPISTPIPALLSRPEPAEIITFTKQQDGTYTQTGESSAKHGRFQWLNDNGKWEGGFSIEPLDSLLARMRQGGPYKYEQYRILPAEKAELTIKPTCASCGINAGTDCQRTCEYIFDRADVTEALPILFNDDHQFNLSIVVVTSGKNFGNERPKIFWFNSVRCAELFLMERGYCKKSKGQIGSGERLLAYLGGTEIAKSRKKSRRSLDYRQAQMQKSRRSIQ